MATVQLADVIVPTEFSDYIVANSVEKTAFWESGVATRNALINAQLQAGADQFSVPIWKDLGNEEANAVNDDPNTDAVPNKLGAVKMLVRKSFLHNSWAAMNFASELSGDDALTRIRDRVSAYWARQWQRRLIASLTGILGDNVANDSGDMVEDISGEAGAAAIISAAAVIDAAGTLGDAAADLRAIAMHSDVTRKLMKDDAIEYIQPSQGASTQIPTYRGLRVITDDAMPVTTGVYTTVLLGSGAVGYGVSVPRIAQGTEIENKPASGKGGGQQILHSRNNMALQPLGFAWVEGTLTEASPTLADLDDAAHWNRVLERKHVPLAFLVHKIA